MAYNPFVRKPYNNQSAAPASRIDRSGDAPQAEKKAEPGSIVPFVNPLADNKAVTIIGAKITDFGVGGAYLNIYCDVKVNETTTVPATLRMGTAANRISSKQARQFMAEQEAAGLELANFQRERIVEKTGEKYTAKTIGFNPEPESN